MFEHAQFHIEANVTKTYDNVYIRYFNVEIGALSHEVDRNLVHAIQRKKKSSYKMRNQVGTV
jgi:hypothetical protein